MSAKLIKPVMKTFYELDQVQKYLKGKYKKEKWGDFWKSYTEDAPNDSLITIWFPLLSEEELEDPCMKIVMDEFSYDPIYFHYHW